MGIILVAVDQSIQSHQRKCSVDTSIYTGWVLYVDQMHQAYKGQLNSSIRVCSVFECNAPVYRS